MSEQLFGEATVHLTPDLTGFVTELKKQVKAAVERVEKTPAAKIRISPALTRDFVGQLRKQVNIATAQAQKGIKPIVVRAVLSEVSRAAIAREIRTGAQTVRATAPAAAPRGNVAATITAATGANQAFSASQERVNGLVSRGAVELDKHMAAIEADTVAQQEANAARVKGAQAHQRAATGDAEETVSARALAEAKRELAQANLAEAGSSQRAAGIRAADLAARRAIVLAIEEQDVATRHAAEGFRLQLRSQAGANEALNETSRAARQAASNMSQLRRGVLSTALSFAGIRGATLAASARFLLGAAAIAVFAKAISSAAATAQQLNVFRATTQATAVELERVAANARALGADLSLPGVTAQDAAEAMTELAKAGLSVEDSIAGARGVLQLATAAAIDNAQATELAANAINAFGLAGRDATHVADVFANAANAAQGSIVDIGIAFQQASAAGRQVGLSFEDTSEFLTVLARNGLKGSDAGTSLRTALIRLVKPTKQAAEELKRLGVETRDAVGNLRPDIFIQLAAATREMAPAQRDATIALIGGQDAFRALTILGRQSIGDFIKLRRELRQQGTAADLASARMTGLRGALEGLGNTLSSIGLKAGQQLTPALQGIVLGASGITQSLSESGVAAQFFSGWVEGLNFQLSALGKTLHVVGALLLPLTGAFLGVVNAVGVPTLITAALAYAGLSKSIALVTAAAKPGRLAILSVAAAINPATFATNGLRLGLASLASSLPLLQIGFVALAAAIFFIATRESEAERNTRKLKAATDDLIASQEKLHQSQTQERDTGLGRNAARLAVINAQLAVGAAQAKLRNSDAAQGTFARTKLETELAVALDNVAIAQNNLADSLKAATQAREEAVQAARNAKDANDAEIASLVEVARFNRNLAETTVTPDTVGRVTDELNKRAQAAREANTAESRALAERIQLLSDVSGALQKIPSDKAIRIALNAPDVKTALDQLVQDFGVAGTRAETILREAIIGGLSTKLARSFSSLGNILKNLIRPPFLGVGESALGAATDGFVNNAPAAADRMAQALLTNFAASLKRAQNQRAGLDVQENLAIIASGATGATLPVDRQRLADEQQNQRDAEAQIAALTAAGKTKGLATARKARAAAIAAQAEIITGIRSTNEQLASEAKTAADDAKTKQDQIFENILKAMGVRRDARQQAIEDAALTEGSGDDLAANRRLRQLVNVQIDRIQERIKAARKQGKNVQALIAGLRILEGIYRDLGRTVRDLQKTRQEEIQARIAESNQLDIEFAQTTGNKNAEIRARLKEIARLKRLQALAKNDILERKRLRNLIADQQKAIDELRKQNDESNRALQELSFSFLTTQQGFAANLLGNLLPIGAIGGTVGANLAARGGGGAGGGGGGGGGGNFGLAGGPQPGGGVIGGFDPSLAAGRGTHGLGGGGGPTAGGGAGGSVISSAATAAGAKEIAGPTRGQQSVELDLLRQILAAIRHLNQATKHPENKAARKRSNAALETHH